MKFDTLILITSRYPYENVTEGVFLSAELPKLSRIFKKVIIMPMVNTGSINDLSFLPDVTVDTTLINSPIMRNKALRMRHLFHRHALEALIRGSFDDLTYSLSAYSVAYTLRKRLKELHLSPENTLLYSYWFESQADGAVLSGYPAIIRAHGHDVWTSRGHNLRAVTLKECMRLFAASDAAAEHFRTEFPESSAMVETAPLGSLNRAAHKPIAAHNRADRKITFLTCARAVKGKRPLLTLEFMKALAVARPGTAIKWIFIGDGEEMPALREASATTMPENLIVEIKGALPNARVHEIYRTEPVDWHILLTTSEGGRPIALCEALSYGVPVISTEAGAVGELIDDDCGLLLPPDPEKEEFVRGIAPYLDSDYRMGQLREAALQRWNDMANADIQSDRFIERLKKL